jgi:hypothetical protein
VVIIDEESKESGSLTFSILKPQFNDLSAILGAGKCSVSSPCSTDDGGDSLTLERAGSSLQFILLRWTSDPLDAPSIEGLLESFQVTARGFSVTFSFFSPAEIPEPGTLSLAALGVGGLALARRRKRLDCNTSRRDR